MAKTTIQEQINNALSQLVGTQLCLENATELHFVEDTYLNNKTLTITEVEYVGESQGLVGVLATIEFQYEVEGKVLTEVLPLALSDILDFEYNTIKLKPQGKYRLRNGDVVELGSALYGVGETKLYAKTKAYKYPHGWEIDGTYRFGVSPSPNDIVLELE